MALGSLQNEGDLQRWLQDQLDTMGLSAPDRGLRDGSLAYALLGTDAKNAFLKLAVAGDRKFAGGSATLVFTASATATVTVNHGLGVTPVAVDGYPLDANASIISTVQAAPNSTSISFAARQYKDVAFTGNVTLYWWAFG